MIVGDKTHCKSDRTIVTHATLVPITASIDEYDKESHRTSEPALGGEEHSEDFYEKNVYN